MIIPPQDILLFIERLVQWKTSLNKR